MLPRDGLAGREAISSQSIFEGKEEAGVQSKKNRDLLRGVGVDEEK